MPWDKKLPKMPLSLFPIGHQLLGMWSTLKSSLFLQAKPWRKLNFHLQLVMNWKLLLGCGQGHVSTSINSRTPSGMEPYQPVRAASISVRSCELWPCWFRGSCVLSVLHPLRLRYFFRLLSWEVSDHCREGFHRDISFRAECSKVSHLCIMSGFGSLYWLPSIAGGRFSADGWARHWFLSIAECH